MFIFKDQILTVINSLLSKVLDKIAIIIHGILIKLIDIDEYWEEWDLTLALGSEDGIKKLG